MGSTAVSSREEWVQGLFKVVQRPAVVQHELPYRTDRSCLGYTAECSVVSRRWASAEKNLAFWDRPLPCESQKVGHSSNMADLEARFERRGLSR